MKLNIDDKIIDDAKKTLEEWIADNLVEDVYQTIKGRVVDDEIKRLTQMKWNGRDLKDDVKNDIHKQIEDLIKKEIQEYIQEEWGGETKLKRMVKRMVTEEVVRLIRNEAEKVISNLMVVFPEGVMITGGENE